MGKEKKQTMPPQQQKGQPGREHQMSPRPQTGETTYRAAGKLQDKVALITGGDSGIGRAVAVAFAKEGADVAIGYLNEHKDAAETRRLVEAEGRQCIAIAGDVGNENFCRRLVEQTVKKLGKLNILVNNAAEQHPQDSLEKISAEQLLRTFKTNIFSMFYLTKAALKHLKKGSAIVCTTSVTAYRGSPSLVDYASTKGAIVAFVRSMTLPLAAKEIRINGVAPGPIWTPLIPATFPKEKVKTFGSDVPMKRPGQPEEVAPCYVFLASNDSSYMTGQVLHPDGGGFIST